MGTIGRRGFIQSLAAAIAAASAMGLDDPEKLLWEPGKKTIFLPSESQAIVAPRLPEELVTKRVLIADDIQIERILPSMVHRYTVETADGHRIHFDDKWAPIYGERRQTQKLGPETWTSVTVRLTDREAADYARGLWEPRKMSRLYAFNNHDT